MNDNQVSPGDENSFTDEDFVVVWTTSVDADEVATRLGKIAGKTITKRFVCARASFMRKAGVKLKNMKRGRKTNVSSPAILAVGEVA